MNHLDRIRQIVAGSGAPRLATASIQTVTDPGGVVAFHDVLGLLEGTLEASADGSCFLIRRKYEPGQPYGTKRIGAYPEPSFDAFDVLTGGTGHRVPSERLCRAIYLDLETTGLSGGAGTVGFIVGLGWFDGGTFHTCQYFLSTPAHERDMLTGVAMLLRRARAIITFNGRSFDGPVMDTRYALHGLASPLDGIHHVDLLHPSRHLWTANEGRLVNLERNILGLRRVGDVAGAEIPGRYIGYLRSGDPRPLVPVLGHNRLDLVSLGVLAGLACQLIQDGAGATEGSVQALGLCRVYERAGRCERAVACYRRAAAIDQSDGRADPSWVPSETSGSAARARALGRLARIYRRRGRHADAADAWGRLLRLSRIPDHLRHEASLALAVHHEHRVRELRTAQQFAVLALEPDLPAIRRQAVQHRLLRLRRKIDATRNECGEKPLLQPTSDVTSTA